MDKYKVDRDIYIRASNQQVFEQYMKQEHISKMWE